MARDFTFYENGYPYLYNCAASLKASHHRAMASVKLAVEVTGLKIV